MSIKHAPYHTTDATRDWQWHDDCTQWLDWYHITDNALEVEVFASIARQARILHHDKRTELTDEEIAVLRADIHVRERSRVLDDETIACEIEKYFNSRRIMKSKERILQVLASIDAVFMRREILGMSLDNIA